MKLFNQTNYIHGSIKEGEGKCLTTEEQVDGIPPGEIIGTIDRPGVIVPGDEGFVLTQI